MDFQAFLNKHNTDSWVIYSKSQTKTAIVHVEKMHVAIDKEGPQLILTLVGDNKIVKLSKEDQLAFLKGEDVSRILNNDEPMLKEIFHSSQLRVKHTHKDTNYNSSYLEIAVGIGMIWVEDHSTVYDFTEEKVLTLSQNPSFTNLQIEYLDVPLNGIVFFQNIKKTLKKLFDVKYLPLLEHFNG